MWALGLCLAQAQQQTMNPDISVVLDVAAAGFSGSPLQLGAHDPVRDGFTLQQLELSVGKAVDPYFRFDSNIVFAPFGVEIEEAYGTTLALPGRTQIRAGQFLTRFGRLNPTHPHSWDFVDQPLPMGRVFGGEGSRGLGVEGSVLLPVPWFAELLVSETMASGASTSASWNVQELGGPQDLLTTAALKQFFALGSDLSLVWGTSWAGGPNPTGRGNRTELYGADLFLKYRPISRASKHQVTVQAEWLHRRYQAPGELLLDDSAYGQAVWRVGRGAVALRYEHLGATRGGEDPTTPQLTDGLARTTLATTFWPTEFSRLRLQGSRSSDGAMAAMLALELDVGAHGAHAF